MGKQGLGLSTLSYYTLYSSSHFLLFHICLLLNKYSPNTIHTFSCFECTAMVRMTCASSVFRPLSLNVLIRTIQSQLPIHCNRPFENEWSNTSNKNKEKL